MDLKRLAALASLIMVGCATPPPKESAMDWAAFIASVQGSAISDVDYKTSTLKRSAHRANTPGLAQTKASFGAWCQTHGGTAADIPPPRGTGVAQSFHVAAAAWSNQDLVLRGDRYSSTSLFCFDGQAQLMAVMFVRTYGGYRNSRYEPDKLPAPVIAFYTPEQAAQFADFYNAKEKERSEAIIKESQRRSDRQAEETRRLRSAPKVGDQTMEGIVIELRPPLALIQYSELQRQMFGKPQSEWVPITSLTAPR